MASLTEIDGYRIELIGRGGMAEVYKAWNPRLQRYEALKLLPPSRSADEEFRRRFLLEARTAARLRHPHIAALYAVSAPDSPASYFTMELVEGGDLSDLLRARESLPLAEAVPILRQIADGLDYAHRQGVVHRDMKPANVLLHRTPSDSLAPPAGAAPPQVKIVDFGIAKAMADGNAPGITRTGVLIGTPEYMSPEQAGNGNPVDGRTDQYALGIIAYEMLCGRPPFLAEQDTSPLSVLMRHLHDPLPPPRRCNRRLPASVEAVLAKALAKQPAQRYASCAEFVRALESVGAGRPVIPRSPRAVYPATAALLALGLLMVGKGMFSQGSVPSASEPVRTAGGAGGVAHPGDSSPDPVTPGVATASPGSVSTEPQISEPTPPARPPEGEAYSPSAPSPAVEPRPGGPAPVEETPDGRESGDPSFPPSWRSFEDSGLGYALEVPAGWKETRKIRQGYVRMEWSSPSASATLILEVGEGTPYASPMGAWTDMDRRFRKVHGNRYRLIGLEESVLGGREAATWTFTQQMRSGATLKKIDVGTWTNGNSYAVLCQAPVEEFGAWESIFDHALESFRIL